MMGCPEETTKSRQHWKIGHSIPQEWVEDCDRLIRTYRALGQAEHLIAAWKLIEPKVRRMAEEAHWFASWRIGNLIEPDDLLSLAKVLLLERLLRLWDPQKGSFLIYALVTCRIEFWKWHRREMLRKGSEEPTDGVEELAGAEALGFIELQLDIEAALQRLETRHPKRGQVARWSFEHLTIPLRELARIHAGKRGYSRGSLHSKRQAAIKHLKAHLEQPRRRAKKNIMISQTKFAKI